MKRCQRCQAHCSRHQREVVQSSLQVREGKVVQVQQGVSIELPLDFFNGFKLKGSMFNLKTVNLDKEKLAVKWVRRSHTCCFTNHIETLQQAAETTAAVITSFMKRIDTKGWEFNVVMPLQGSTENLEIGVEPFVENMEQFNSNSFWECNAHKTYQKLALALAHFSYAASKGEYVLTHLQGGVDKKRKVVTLLAPNLVSEELAKFGCTDLGKASGFFARHKCNSFCYDIPRSEGESKGSSLFRVPEI